MPSPQANEKKVIFKNSKKKINFSKSRFSARRRPGKEAEAVLRLPGNKTSNHLLSLISPLSPKMFQVRDACIIENGEEACGKLIEAHKACMRAAGFNV